MFKLLFSSLVFLIAGCDTPPSTPTCPSDQAAEIVGTAVFNMPQAQLDTDLVVSGTALHRQGLAIRQVLVDGVEATNTGYNFSSWNVTVPIKTLAAMVKTTNQATLVAIAVDSCGRTAQFFESMPVAITTMPGIRVTALQATATPPAAQAFIPANNSIPAVLQITANPEAAGATASVNASIGTIQGAPNGTVTLSGDGKTGPASASLLFVSNKSGNALITVSAGNLTRAIPVLVADPPLLVPTAATLGAGQQLTVSAISQGKISSCQISAGSGLAATSTLVNEGRIDIVIKAATTAMSGTAVQLACLDAFGQQSGQSVYSVQ